MSSKAQKEEIYLDYAAWAPPSETVREKISSWLNEIQGNPSSPHLHGRRAAVLLERARAQIAQTLNLADHQIYFCSCGTEANNLACNSILQEPPNEVVYVTPLEHPSILEYLKERQSHGLEVVWTPLEENGLVDCAKLLLMLNERPGPVIVQWVNQETGLVQDIESIANLTQKMGVTMHVDAIQGFLRLTKPLPKGVSSVSVSSGKIGGLSGSAAFLLRKEIKPAPLLWGGGQEQGTRPGTVNVMGALSFASAISGWSDETRMHLEKLKSGLLLQLKEIQGVSLAVNPNLCAPHIAYLLVEGWQGQDLQRALAREGISVSVGTACKGSSTTESPYLKAIGYQGSTKLGIRVSWGMGTSELHIKSFVEKLKLVTQSSNGQK
jgi:cysteine desulfurase